MFDTKLMIAADMIGLMSVFLVVAGVSAVVVTPPFDVVAPEAVDAPEAVETDEVDGPEVVKIVDPVGSVDWEILRSSIAIPKSSPDPSVPKLNLKYKVVFPYKFGSKWYAKTQVVWAVALLQPGTGEFGKIVTLVAALSNWTTEAELYQFCPPSVDVPKTNQVILSVEYITFAPSYIPANRNVTKKEIFICVFGTELISIAGDAA